MKVSQAMHKGVKQVPPTASVAAVAKLMKTDDIGAVAVSDADKIVGIVTDRDLAIRALANDGDASALTARDVMTANPACCTENDDIDSAVETMAGKKIRRLPVTDAKNRLVGMLSLGDIAHAVDDKQSGELIEAVSAHHGS
ncbi:MAG: CBS domain-containing protein [Alphaproteobacteria bacterium]|nr:CBS domain-containing protein [Alphaproteobacteria bacterium]